MSKSPKSKASIHDKVEYVRKAPRGDRTHHCHWPGCKIAVKPALWGCAPHWYKLPKVLRDLIWKTFQPGQEETKLPSMAYIVAAKKVRQWINAHYPETRKVK